MRMEFLTRYHAHLICSYIMHTYDCVESYVMIPRINGTGAQAAAAVERIYVCNLF